MTHRSMDPWRRQHQMARTTLAWSALSMITGARWLRHPNPWWRSFGQQHLGWGLVDLVIVAVVEGVQHRRRSRLPDPYGPATLAREGGQLHRILMINAGLDVGYCLMGLILWRARQTDPRAAGAGVAIMIQGGFLLLHDAHHAYGSGLDR